MQLSSALCRAQEGIQRDRAAGALLDNIRIVAEKAAVVWAQEALFAEQREARHAQAHQRMAKKNAQQGSMSDDRAASENPDRGLADY